MGFHLKLKAAIKSLLILFILAAKITLAQENIEFTYNNFRNLTGFFHTREDLLEFFDFKKGDVIADIGAGNGIYSVSFATLADSLTIYAEDVDMKELNYRKLNKKIKKYSGIKGSPLQSKIVLQKGTYKSTNLPSGQIDKVIMIASFH